VNDRRLVAYVVPQSAPFDTAASRAALAKTLPPYMIPSEWIVLDEFPRTPNGKLDRAALPRPQWGQPARSGGRPADAATERAISGVWCDLLGHDGFGIDDDFFAVGGHSLLALRAITRIGEVLGRSISLRDFFGAPTVRELARCASAAQPNADPRVAADDVNPTDFAEIEARVAGLSDDEVDRLLRETLGASD
ncbi:MAG: phosphopantetheine-binding protein, partial [Vulcanimicrobiaceae bacterium]